MARRYDSRTTIFSPEGRLFQVEYAMEAISNAGAALGVRAVDGVVLAAEKKITSKVCAPAASWAGLPCSYACWTHACYVCSCWTQRLSESGERKCTSWTTTRLVQWLA